MNRSCVDFWNKAMFVAITKMSLVKKKEFTNQTLTSAYSFSMYGYTIIYILIVLFSLPFASEVDAPFARWSKDQVCDWLQEQGLGLYVNMARVWISSGQTLLQASQVDLERVR